MNDWHEVVPALNSLLITLAIYVFLLLNVEIRNRIHALEQRRTPAQEARSKGPEARNGGQQTDEEAATPSQTPEGENLDGEKHSAS